MSKIYTAFSKHNFYARYQISAYVLNQNLIPLNPFTNWEYFMCDMVNRDLIKRANNNLIEIANELWVFGQIADGVYFEIELAKQLGLKIKFFSLGKNLSDIQPLKLSSIIFEDELLTTNRKADLLTFLNSCI